MPRKPKQIAPRLASGKPRDSYGGRLPHEIRIGLKTIAMSENKSVSWVMETLILRNFKKAFAEMNIQPPEYIPRKKKE